MSAGMPRAAVALAPGIVAGLVAAVAWWSPPAASMPDQVTIPIVAPHPGGIPATAATFRHGTHRQGTCYTCHPTLFPRYPLGFTHADMAAGRFCGACHDGRVAFAVIGRPCEECHEPR